MEESINSSNKKYDNSYSPNEWLDASIVFMTKHGIGNLSIEKLAELTRKELSEFYEVYSDLNGLYDDILKYYHQNNHRYYIEMLAKHPGDVSEKLKLVFQHYITREENGFELAVRQWARKNDDVCQFIRRLDKQKMLALVKMFEEGGFTHLEAYARGRMLLLAYIGKLHYGGGPDNEADRAELFRITHKIMTTKFDDKVK